MVNFTEENTFKAMIGCSVTESFKPSGFSENSLSELYIPPQKYLAFRYRGGNSIAELNRLYRHIFSTGLLKRRAELAYSEFFHYYSGNQLPGDSQYRATINFFLPLKSV